MSESGWRRGVVLCLVLVLGVGGIALAGARPVPGVSASVAAVPQSPTPSPAAYGGTGTLAQAFETPVVYASPTARRGGPTLLPSTTPDRSPASLTPTPGPTPTWPPAQQTEVATGSATVIGTSVQGRPILAHRFGVGTLKVALVSNIHGQAEENTYRLARELVAHFQSNPGEVPDGVSLWIVPSANPDGLETGHRWNANGVDLNRNADTDLDGCARNDWSTDSVGLEGPHPGAGGAYPFSEPETRALRDFLADAWVAVFYHSAAGAIYADACQQHLPSARLAEVLSAGSGYPVPAEGWAGYAVRGDLADYLAGEGVAAATVELTDHEETEFERNLGGVRALLGSAGEVVAAETLRLGGAMVWLAPENTGVWHYPTGSLVHPLALEVAGSRAYALDGGRVLLLDLDRPAAPRVLLAPGDGVDGVRVLEPLDLAAAEDGLLVLDRAGDLYRYDPATAAWSLERTGRAPGTTYDHFYVAVAAAGQTRYLLETTHEQVWRFLPGTEPAVVAGLPTGRDVDIGVAGADVFVLARAMYRPEGSLQRYTGGQRDESFGPALELVQPRQLAATGTALYVLDRAGRRVLQLDAATGALQGVLQFVDRSAVGAIWVPRVAPSREGPALILAGRDALYFYGQPGRTATVEGTAVPGGTAPVDPALLEGLRGLRVPIAGAHVSIRDFQMPGAPRHYRLGVHEGIDFYSGSSGPKIDGSTEVRAVADGVVVRALLDYQPLTAGQAAAWRERCRQEGYTPPEVLDGYRGRQIWIEHEDGLVSRYAHLGSIAPGLTEGVSVRRGQVIGRAGNSGTPESVGSSTIDVHLHLELWLGDHYLGKYLRPIEVREWLEKILR